MSREPNPTDGTGLKAANSILVSSSKNEQVDQLMTCAMTA